MATSTQRAHRGKALEAMLNFGHQLYVNRFEDVRVEHNGTRGTWKSQGGKGVFVPDVSKSAPDYYGSIAGQMIVFDAKTTQNKKVWRLKSDSAHQYLAMLDWSKARAICWFAVEHKLDEVLYMLKVSHLKPWLKSLPSMTFPPPVDIGIIACPMIDGWYDWLPLVRFGWIDE